MVTRSQAIDNQSPMEWKDKALYSLFMAMEVTQRIMHIWATCLLNKDLNSVESTKKDLAKVKE